MRMAGAVSTAGRIGLLTVLLFALFVLWAGVAGLGAGAEPAAGATREPGSSAAAQTSEAEGALALLVVCLIQSALVTLAIRHSRWRGWRLTLSLFAVSYAMLTVLTQVETLFFVPQIPGDQVARIFLFGLLLTASFAPLAVALSGRWRTPVLPEPTTRPRSLGRWASAVAGLALLHTAIYFVCGYYLAWRHPQLRAFYGGEDPGGLWLQLAATVRDAPWLVPFQLARGTLWGLVAVVTALMLSGSRIRAALVAAAFMGLFAQVQLLLPNPWMPEDVRAIHLVETVVSRAAFGFAAVWLLRGGESGSRVLERAC